MRDVVFEWYVPYVISKNQRLLKATAVSAAIVFFVDAVFFASVMLIPSLLAAAAAVYLSMSLKYEYEYVYVNGDFTISKIVRKSKRKDVYHVARTEIEVFTEGRNGVQGSGKIPDFTSGRPGAQVYTIKARGQLVHIEPSQEFVDEMKKYRLTGGV